MVSLFSVYMRRLARRISSIVLGALMISSMQCLGQQVTVLQHVTIIDGDEHAAMRNKSVVMNGDSIESILPSPAHVPAGAKVIDMHDQTIMPLIICTHGHLGLVKGTSQSADNQTEDNLRHQLSRYEMYGVGAVLSMGTDGKKFAEWRDESRRGTLPGADIYTAGIGFGAKDGVPPASMGFTGVFRPTTAAEARDEVAQEAPLKPDFIKLWLDDFWGQYPKMQPEIYTAIIDEAHKRGLKVAAHVYHMEDARKLVDAGVDVLAHSVRDGELDDALLAKMKKQHVVYIPTLSLDDFAFAYQDSPAWVNDRFFQAALDPGVLDMLKSPEYKEKVRKNKVTPQEAAALPVAMRNLKRVHDAGILISLGSDSGATPIRVQGFAEHMELVLMVQAGLTPLQAISVATRNGAEMLGIADQYGTLAPGKKANFIVLEKDPSTNIQNTQTIKQVWKNGQKVSDGPL